MFVDIIKAATIDKAIDDFRKRLYTCVSVEGGHFEHIM